MNAKESVRQIALCNASLKKWLLFDQTKQELSPYRRPRKVGQICPKKHDMSKARVRLQLHEAIYRPILLYWCHVIVRIWKRLDMNQRVLIES